MKPADGGLVEKDGGAWASHEKAMTRQEKNDTFLLTSFLYGGNADYIEQLAAHCHCGIGRAGLARSLAESVARLAAPLL